MTTKFAKPIDLDTSWIDKAECSGLVTNLFYPEQGGAAKEQVLARQVCARCPVQDECLEYALLAGERFGIWGGTSERQRRKIRRARGLKDID